MHLESYSNYYLRRGGCSVESEGLQSQRYQNTHRQGLQLNRLRTTGRPSLLNPLSPPTELYWNTGAPLSSNEDDTCTEDDVRGTGSVTRRGSTLVAPRAEHAILNRNLAAHAFSQRDRVERELVRLGTGGAFVQRERREYPAAAAVSPVDVHIQQLRQVNHRLYEQNV
jgi:hypothetical protein